MCGISGVIMSDPREEAVHLLYESLMTLQHRGQDAAGILTSGEDGKVYCEKGPGLVREVFDREGLDRLKGNHGVAHVRYPTSGSKSKEEAQPFYTNSPYGIAFVHNGNLTNSIELSGIVRDEFCRHSNTDSDSELLLNIFAHALGEISDKKLTEESIYASLRKVYSLCKGGYSCIGLIPNFGIFGFRDYNGIRPLVCGSRKSATGMDYMFASETAALSMFKFKDYFDLCPGEAVVITKDKISRRIVAPGGKFAPDIFEYIYFARADSVIDGVSVHQARVAMGDALAGSVAKKLNTSDIDSIVPVPDTGRLSALQLSRKLDIPYREGFIKNRYIGRTFIMPSQKERILNIRRKITPIVEEFKDKVVLLVDDSIVRGTTSREIIAMAREAGAKKVYLASCSPPIRYPNVYGLDTPTRAELIACNRSEAEVSKQIDADGVVFQEICELTEAITSLNKNLTFFDLSVFTGLYVTGDIDENYMRDLELRRGLPSGTARGDAATSPGHLRRLHTISTSVIPGNEQINAWACSPDKIRPSPQKT